MNSDLFSLVVYARWNCLSSYRGIVFVGAFSWPAWQRKRITVAPSADANFATCVPFLTLSLQCIWYCWWKNSCASWYVVYLTIYEGFLYIPGSCLGFLPSTVWIRTPPELLDWHAPLLIFTSNWKQDWKSVPCQEGHPLKALQKVEVCPLLAGSWQENSPLEMEDCKISNRSILVLKKVVLHSLMLDYWSVLNVLQEEGMLKVILINQCKLWHHCMIPSRSLT